jgi:hypothetical protein
MRTKPIDDPIAGDDLEAYFPQHFLNFFWLPQGQSSFLPTFGICLTIGESAWWWVQFGPWTWPASSWD